MALSPPTILNVISGDAELIANVVPIEIPDKVIWYQISAFTGENADTGTIATSSYSVISFSRGSLINGVTYKIVGKTLNITDGTSSEWSSIWGTIVPNSPTDIDYNSVIAENQALTSQIRFNLAYASSGATINETTIDETAAINKLKTSLVYKNNVDTISLIKTIILPQTITTNTFNINNESYYYIPTLDNEEINFISPLLEFSINQTSDTLTISSDTKTQVYTNSDIANSTQIFSLNGQNVYIYGKGSLLFRVDCLCDNSFILTPNGFKSIKDLQNGDLIITDDQRIVPIVNIYKFNVVGNSSTYPVIIPKNGLRKGYPNKPIAISPNHAIKVKNNWILAKNIRKIEREIKNEIVYYHIELPNFLMDNLILEGNLVVESYGKNCNYKKVYNRNKLFKRVKL